MSNDYEEVDYVIKTLKTSNLQEDKTLVLLSSVMTWVNTPPKFEELKDGEEGEEGGEEGGEGEDEESSEPGEDYLADKEKKDEEDVEEPVEETSENGTPIVIKKPVFYKEEDFYLRVPHANFEALKTLETVAMSAVNT